MDQDDCDIPGQNQWEAAQRARISGRAYLASSNLPATEQELLLDKALELLVQQFRRGRPVQFPEAWIRTILRQELGKRRQRGFCSTLEGEVVAEAAAAPGLHDLLVDPWDLVERHETLFLGRLTNHERLVYHAVRQGWSLKRCAQELSMSERDVRTRFGRICNKLDGFLAYLVPPCTREIASSKLRRRRIGRVRQPAGSYLLPPESWNSWGGPVPRRAVAF